MVTQAKVIVAAPSYRTTQFSVTGGLQASKIWLSIYFSNEKNIST